MSTLKLDELIVGAGLTLKRTATGVYKFFKTSSTNVVNTPIEMNDSGLILDNPNALVSPNKHDRTTKLATMATLGSELGNYSNYINISANTSITFAHSGAFLNVTASGSVQTLDTTNLILGSKFTFNANFVSGTFTIASNNGGVFNIPGVSTPTTLVLGVGESVSFVYAGGNTFVVDTNSGGTKFGYNFIASKTTNGYQRLPSGLILQWGQGQFFAQAGNVQTPTLPITYPNAHLLAWATNASSTGPGGVPTPPSVGALALSQSQVQIQNHINVPYNTYYNYISIGY